MFNQGNNDNKLYDVLGINRNASETEIKKAYKKSSTRRRMPNSGEILDRYGRPETPMDKSQERRG